MLCITYCPISFAQIIPTHTNFSLATVLLSLAKLEKDLGNRISSVQSLSQVRLFATPWTAARQASLSFTNSWSWWCPSSWWCHPTISSSVVPFSSCPQSFPASGSFPISWLFISGGHSIGASASMSVLPMNVQGWFPLGLTGLTSLQTKWISRVFSSTTIQKHQFFGAQPSLWSNSHIYTLLLEKT